jgi:hypothetical protein
VKNSILWLPPSGGSCGGVFVAGKARSHVID